MKLHTRKRIFYVFLLLFVVLGVAVSLFAEGWRLDFSTGKVDKAGGIYVHSYPDDAAIKLDGAFIQNQSAFLSRGTFISGLFPKTYTIQLSATGYDSWTEQSQVLPSLVSEMKYAVLVPQTAMNVATSENVQDFFEIGSDVITENTTGSIMLGGAPIGAGTIVSHSANLKTAIIQSTNPKTHIITYWLYNFTKATSTNLNPILQQAGIAVSSEPNIFIDPYDGTSILVQTKSTIISIDSDTLQASLITTVPTGEIIQTPIAISPSTMAWTLFFANGAGGTTSASSTSRIVVYDKFSSDVIDSSLTVPSAVKQLAWVNGNELGILEENNALYLYNISGESLKPLANDVKQFYPTTDGSAIAALEYNSLEVFFFNTSDYYRFPLPDIGNVEGLMWYKDENHLFVIYPDHVSFLDFTDTNLKNFTTVSAGTDPFYDEQENSLYLIDQGQKLLRFDFPQ